MHWVEVARLADLPEGRPAAAEASGRLLVLVRRGGAVHALDGLCPHKFGFLADGSVAGGRLACPVHAASFDLATGASDQPWAPPLSVHPVRVVDGRVEVQVPGAEPRRPSPAV